MGKLSKKTLALIISLCVITVLLFAAILITNQESKKIVETTPQPSPVESVIKSILSIQPDVVSLDANGNGVINVEMDTDTNQATGVQLELQYDPKAITNVKLISGDFLPQPNVLMNNIDKQKGTITYMAGLNPSTAPVKGKGIVAVITFSKLSGSKLNQTSFSILPESKVTAQGVDNSVLKETHSATIILSK